MKLDLLLQSLGAALGMNDLALNEHGVVSLEFEGRYRITIEPDPDGEFFHLYSPLCRIPEDAAARYSLYEALLTANCYGRGTLGSSFAIDEASAEVVLGRRFDGESTQGQELVDALRGQLTVLDHWHTLLPEVLHPAAAHAEMSFESTSQLLRA